MKRSMKRAMNLPILPPFEPMLAKLTRELPRRDDVLYEPKWDGFRCVIFRDGDALDLQSRNQKPLLRYFPELVEPLLANLPDRVVLDGELAIATPTGLDFDALQLRQHPAESRVRKLAAEIPASYIAFDLLADGDELLLDVPMRDRRARLVDRLGATSAPVHVTPASSDADVGADWFHRFEGAGLDGVMVKPLSDPYRPGQRTLFKVKHDRTADCVVGGYRVHKDGEGVGSLLLGLYDDAGDLHHVGVASSLAAPARAELMSQLAPYLDGALDGHPWRAWAEAAAQDSAGQAAPHGTSRPRLPGGQSRWTGNKDLSFVPLRPELVAEVAYEGMLSGRFRHNARLRRLRPDRDAPTCTFDQLHVVPPVELQLLLGKTSSS
jgi:ATP-dependent DNA ligase